MGIRIYRSSEEEAFDQRKFTQRSILDMLFTKVIVLAGHSSVLSRLHGDVGCAHRIYLTFRKRTQRIHFKTSYKMGDDRPKKKVKTESNDVNGDAVAANPYLAHLAGGSSTKSDKDKKSTSLFDSKLPELIPGETDAAQQIAWEESPINPFNGKPFSPHYYEILKKRRALPVQKQRQEFLDMVHKSQCVVLVGETGSGKTTQCVFRAALHSFRQSF